MSGKRKTEIKENKKKRVCLGPGCKKEEESECPFLCEKCQKKIQNLYLPHEHSLFVPEELRRQ